MRKITEKGLEKYLDRKIRVEREGVEGNLGEGVVLGILQKDGEGFYVKQFITSWDDGFGRRIDHKHFYDVVYRITEGDIIIHFRQEYIFRNS